MTASPSFSRTRFAPRLAVAAVGLTAALAFAGQAHATTCGTFGSARTLSISQDHEVQLYRHYGGTTLYWWDNSDGTNGNCGSISTTTSIDAQGTAAGGERLISLNLGGGSDRLRIEGQYLTKDKITIGQWGIGLNADADVDIALYGALDEIQAQTYTGDDTISGRGGGAFGGPTTTRLSLAGDGGKDILKGGNNDDSLEGGANNDTINGFAGNDVIYLDQGRDIVDAGAGNDEINSFDNEVDKIKGGAGLDTAYVDGYDVVSAVETIA
jgi:Ca2+-binding RTX toxin-like protein